MKPSKSGISSADSQTEPKVMANDPLAEDDILEHFYRPQPTTASPRAEKEKPAHYKIVCISLYNEDIARLESLVRAWKKMGHTKANKSQVIRVALEQLDLSRVPKIR